MHNTVLKQVTENKIYQSPILAVSQARKKREGCASSYRNNAWKENRRENLLCHKMPEIYATEEILCL